jgi:hypothetical protein|nr:MAG TPA: hypothetical protein [Caudoviricetes sp.]
MKSRPVPTRRVSKAQEKKVAKLMNGRVQSNSGATPFLKGDVVTDKFLIECKTVMKPQTQVTIKKEWFTKNEEERFAMKKDYSAVVFDFGDNDDQFIAMKLKDFNLLMIEGNFE